MMPSTPEAPHSASESRNEIDASELEALDQWWRAANYLTVGQIYLQGNPLLHEPLRP